MFKQKPLFTANWKMSLTHKDGQELAKKMKKCKLAAGVEIVVCPSFDQIEFTQDALHSLPVRFGAQNMFWEDQGSFTGEVSPVSLHQMGLEYVIIGHSERRHILGETDEMVNKKMQAAFRNNLIPILCVGETFEERQEGRKDTVVSQQVTKALEGVKLDKHHQFCIAYEPVWVIGSGQAVDPEEAVHTSRVIRQVVVDHFHNHERAVDEFVRFLYGGSVTSENAALFVQDVVQGVLVGGASLKPDEFCGIVESLAKK